MGVQIEAASAKNYKKFETKMRSYVIFLIVILSMWQESFSKPSAKADHVKVTLYYEALCGGCHDWILNEMFPTYQKIGKYMEVDFVPYGNAHVYIYSTNLIIPRLFSWNDLWRICIFRSL